jgi:hypothetical protein
MQRTPLSARVFVAITADEHQHVAALAQRDQISISEVMRRALRAYLKRKNKGGTKDAKIGTRKS